MKYPRVSAVLVFLMGLCGSLAAQAQDTCYYNTVPTSIDFPIPAGEACRIGVPNSNAYDPYTTVPNDYAILYFDAKKPGCAAGARDRLEAKLRANLDYANSGGKICDPRRDTNGALPTTDPFQSHLSGGVITGIFSTAVTLLDAGYSVDDALLQGVRDHHTGVPSPQDPRCGVNSLPNVNSCMDDYTVTAAGFGWIAAYELKRGRTTDPITGLNWANRAKGEINKALSRWTEPYGTPSGSICYYPKGSNPGRCDATRADVEANLANLIGADHNQENPAYGLGLMTSVATACEGLKRANSACSFTSDQIWTAQQLLIHGQQRTHYDTTTTPRRYRFTPWCRHFPDGASIGCWDPLFGPSGEPGYLPTLFPIKRFYDSMGLTPSPLSTVIHNGWGEHPAYQFHEYDEPRFTWDRTNFWGPLRKLFYQELAAKQESGRSRALRTFRPRRPSQEGARHRSPTIATLPVSQAALSDR